MPEILVTATSISVKFYGLHRKITTIISSRLGTEWLPSEQSQYSEETIPNSCTFKCKNSVPWNGNECVLSE